jgi:hypothetical protein
MPGQDATVFAQGKPGLSLSGSGTFSPIEQGRPRTSPIKQIMVPKSGFSVPRHAANGQFNHALGNSDHIAAHINSAQRNPGGTGPGVTRISSSLGEVKLNFHSVTHGLAHGAISTRGSARSVANKDTVWASREAGSATGGGNGSNQASSNDGGSSASAATGISAANISGVTGAIAAIAAPGNSNGNGNANGNGNGNANGNGNGRGLAKGHNK